MDIKILICYTPLILIATYNRPSSLSVTLSSVTHLFMETTMAEGQQAVLQGTNDLTDTID